MTVPHPPRRPRPAVSGPPEDGLEEIDRLPADEPAQEEPERRTHPDQPPVEAGRPELHADRRERRQEGATRAVDESLSRTAAFLLASHRTPSASPRQAASRPAQCAVGSARVGSGSPSIASIGRRFNRRTVRHPTLRPARPREPARSARRAARYWSRRPPTPGGADPNAAGGTG